MKRVGLILMWSLLLTSLTPAQRQAPSPFPVPLNHFYLTLDHETYAAIEGSPFLRTEFAPFERRTTVRTDRTYTGIYFYGAHTYFEFFDATTQTQFTPNHSGVAFGVERPGALKLLQSRLAAADPGLITRQYNGLQLPWFYILGLEGFPADSVLDSWVMEYHPRFLAEWHPEAGGGPGILRSQVLRRYTDVLQDVPRRPYFQDVVGLTIAADAASAARMRELCENFGYRSRTQGDATVLEGPDIVLRLIPETADARGIKQVIFRVRQRPRGQAEFRFGPRSVLKFQGDGRAVWYF